MNRIAFRFSQPAEKLPFDGERYVSGLLGNAGSGDIQSEHYHRYLFALRYCEGKDVLDIASGEGYGSHCLGQVARTVIGVDANAEAVEFANRHYLSERVSFKLGKAQALPIDDHSVDVIVSFETLEHFTEHEAFAAEAQRVLRLGGLLLISSPNRTVYTEEANYHNEWHLRELNRAEFLAYLQGSFRHVRLFAQRPLLGSVIADDSDDVSCRPEGFISKDQGIFHRTDGLPHPPFYIALASNAKLPEARASVLQNPALLLHIDAQRQEATELAAVTSARVGELEAALAAATAAHVAELDAVRAAASRADAEREQLFAARLEAARREGAETARQAAATILAARMYRFNKRMDMLRTELRLSRSRNEELSNEVASLLTQSQTPSAEANLLRTRNAELSAGIRALQAERAEYVAIRRSSFWRATGPARRLASRLPPATRRRIRSVIGTGLRIFSRDFRDPMRIDDIEPPLPVLWDAGEAPLLPATPSSGSTAIPPAVGPRQLLPSELQRGKDPTWVKPMERPEFVQLRGHRPQARIAVVAHVYYPDLWPEMMEAIDNIPEAFDLFVTLVVGASDQLAQSIQLEFPGAHVLCVDNHGRDILPLLLLARTGALFGYELICKVHTKRSLYREGGDTWRKDLIAGILGGTSLIERILTSFRSNPDLGMVIADGQTFAGRVFWAANEDRSRKLFRDLGIGPGAFERAFAGGSIFWIRPLILRPLSALPVEYDDFEPEPLPNDGCLAHTIERMVSVLCHDAGMHMKESGNTDPEVLSAPAARVHVIANYLPQFHPTPENDRWWGEGFTEWTNVTRAQPLFAGHRQPRLPTALGFYDLRLPEVRRQQAEMARRYGITGFSYYYYWFNGRKLLNKPIEDMLSSGDPDFPFMICWANEPWTRNWDGLSREILMPQEYSPGWEAAFAADTAPLLRDPRYIRMQGRPMVAIYRVAHFPDPVGSVGRLRAAYAGQGLPEVHLLAAWVQLGDDHPLPENPSDMGLDAYFEFPPHGIPVEPFDVPQASRGPGFRAHTYDFGATVDVVLDSLAASRKGLCYRGVMMGWDNTARRGAGSHVFHGATPTNFRRWLRGAVSAARSEAAGGESAVFINAWNEWAEGTYLEPDREFGTGWLEAVASAVA